MATTSVGFSFTTTQFVVILYMVGAIAVGIHAYSDYKSRQPTPMSVEAHRFGGLPPPSVWLVDSSSRPLSSAPT